jgi:hypothetical protein
VLVELLHQRIQFGGGRARFKRTKSLRMNNVVAFVSMCETPMRIFKRMTLAMRLLMTQSTLRMVSLLNLLHDCLQAGCYPAQLGC